MGSMISRKEWSCMVQYGTVRRGALGWGVVWSCLVWADRVWHSMAGWHGALRYGMVARHSMRYVVYLRWYMICGIWCVVNAVWYNSGVRYSRVYVCARVCVYLWTYACVFICIHICA